MVVIDIADDLTDIKDDIKQLVTLKKFELKKVIADQKEQKQSLD